MGKGVQQQTETINKLKIANRFNQPYNAEMTSHLQLPPLSSRSTHKFDDSKQLALLQYDHLVRVLNTEATQIEQEKNQADCYLKFLQRLGVCCLPCSLCCCRACLSFPLYQQQTGALGLLTKFGKYESTVPPGLKLLNPLTQKILPISLKTKTLQIRQQILTKDNVQAHIQSVIFYRIYQPFQLAYRLGSEDGYVQACVSEIAMASLRTVAGCVELQGLVERREEVGLGLAAEINRQVNTWGIIVDICCIKQLHLTQDIAQTLAAVANTRRRSQALLINAKANVECAKLLKEAADILDNKAAMQIRYLEAVEEILGNGKSENVIFLGTLPERNGELL